MGERHAVIEGGRWIAILCPDASFCPSTKFKLFFSASILTIDEASNEKTAGAVDSNVGTTFPLVNTQVAGICAVSKIPSPFVSILPYIVGPIDVGQSTTAIQPNLTQFTRHWHVDVEGISSSQLIPTNPRPKVIPAGFFVLIYWNGNGIENIAGQYRF